jgi:TolB protein
MSWTSSNPSVATASSTAATAAAVEALGAGTVTLTGTQEGKSASITLRVTPRPTHDLIYNTFDAQNKAEIFVLSLSGNGAAPVKLNAGNVSRDPSPSPDGSRFVFAVSQTDGLGRQQHDLYVVNRNGLNMRQLTNMPGREFDPAWSPDGTKIVFRATDAADIENSLWTVNADGTDLKMITGSLPGGVTDPAHPAWSPDGSRIAFTAAHDFTQSVWTMNADGSNLTQVTTDNGFDITPAWSPNGSKIAFSRYNSAAPANGWDVMIVSAAGGTPERLTLPGDQLSPAWSPDGQYIAVTGTAVVAGQGTQNIYTLRPDGSGLRLRTVNVAWQGGLNPAWITRQ